MFIALEKLTNNTPYDREVVVDHESIVARVRYGRVNNPG